jgi:hypothetical protein
MTDDQRPAALTGATGDLTPDDIDEAFVPAERRLMEQDTTSGTDIPVTEPPSMPGATPDEQPAAVDVQVDPENDRY